MCGCNGVTPWGSGDCEVRWLELDLIEPLGFTLFECISLFPILTPSKATLNMILFISIKENFRIQFIVCFPFHLLNISSICFQHPCRWNIQWCNNTTGPLASKLCFSVKCWKSAFFILHGRMPQCGWKKHAHLTMPNDAASNCGTQREWITKPAHWSFISSF